MARSFFCAVVSNVPAPLRGRVIEALVAESANHHEEPSVVINLDPDTFLPPKPGRPSKENTMSRYGRSLRSTNIPVLAKPEAEAFFHDAARGKVGTLFEDRFFTVLLKAVPDKEKLKLFDAMCFLVTPDHAGIPFVFDAVQKLRSARRTLPIRLVICGEPKIEAAAGFFVQMKQELTQLGGDYADCSFAGSVFADPEEVQLAHAFDRSLLEAFPEGTFHGQVKHAAARVFHFDHSEQGFDIPTRAQDLWKLCKQ